LPPTQTILAQYKGLFQTSIFIFFIFLVAPFIYNQKKSHIQIPDGLFKNLQIIKVRLK